MSFLKDIIMPCVYAFLSCAAFCIIFNIRGLGIVRTSIGGVIGWLVFSLTGQGTMSAFYAAVMVGLYCEIMARIMKCPVTGYLVVALLPLVPGGGIYRSMQAAINGYTTMFLNNLLYTFGMAAALAIGAMVSSSVFRLIYSHLHRTGRLNRRS